MQNPVGRVLSVHLGSNIDQAMVEVVAGVVCERCAAGKGCGAGLLGSTPQTRQIAAVIDTDIEVADGDIVSLALLPVSVLRAAIIVYGYPLAGAVVAATAAYAAGFSDGTAALLALGGIGGGFCLARYRLQGERCLREFTPIISAKLPATALDD